MSFISTSWLFISIRVAIVSISLLLVTEMKAQIIQPQRFEMPWPSFDKQFDVISAGESGLYLNRKLYGSKIDQLQLMKLDTALKEQWNGYLTIERDYIQIGKEAYKNRLYLLLRYKDFSKNDLILFVVESDGKYHRYNIKGYIPFSPGEFHVTDEAALIGGYYNHVPIVLYFSLTKFNSRVLPGLFNESGELTQIRTYPDASFDILISAQNARRQRTMWVKNYDPEGNLKKNFALKTDDNKHLIFGRSIKTNNNSQIVAGVFGARSSEFSHGIFVASIDPAGTQQIRYYQFADLENFFKYMKAKREQRVKSRIERRKIKGKRIRLNYRFMVHELVPYNNQFILLGEAFYPRYKTIDRGYGTYGPTLNMSQSGRIFDGYYYTHAVVIGFKPNGDLLWDNSFEINDVKTFTLEQFVKLEIHDDEIALLYLFDNDIRTKIIQNNQVLEGKAVDPIRTGKAEDVIKRNSYDVNKLEYWYQDYLFAYGVQEIEKTVGQSKRRVFYINKVKHVR
jgi:hypothetical protein